MIVIVIVMLVMMMISLLGFLVACCGLSLVLTAARNFARKIIPRIILICDENV